MGDFIQELLPNQRGTEVHDGKGNVLGWENVYEVSDEEIEDEFKDQAMQELIAQKVAEIKARG